MYSVLGDALRERGNADGSLKAYLTAVELAEKNGFTDETAPDLINIGVEYSRRTEYSKSVDYYDRAAKLARETGSTGEITALGNLFSVHTSLDHVPQAFETFNRLKEASERTRTPLSCSRALEFGYLYFNLQKWTNALEVFRQAQPLCIQQNDKVSELLALAARKTN